MRKFTLGMLVKCGSNNNTQDRVDIENLWKNTVDTKWVAIVNMKELTQTDCHQESSTKKVDIEHFVLTMGVNVRYEKVETE